MDTRHLWTRESLRKGLFGFSVICTSKNTADRSTTYLSATTRKTPMALDAPVLWREAWSGYDGGRGEGIERNDCSVYDDTSKNSGYFHG